MSLEKRYAKALFELAQDAGQVEQCESQLSQVAEAWEAQAELRGVFEDPSFSPEQRRQILSDVASRLGASKILRNTLWLMSDRKRLAALPLVAAAFKQLADEGAGRLHAEVISATPLSDAYYEQLRTTLEKVTGKKIVLDTRQDPTLIAGVVTKVGDKVFDGSARHRLGELKEELLQTES